MPISQDRSDASQAAGDSLDLTRIHEREPFAWLSAELAALLPASDPRRIDGVLSEGYGVLLRRLPDRENWRIDLPHPGGGIAFLKKHRRRADRRLLPSFLASRRSESPALVEARNIRHLTNAGIDSMRLLACGQRADPRGGRESFLVTAELSGFVQLDHFLRKRFACLNEIGHQNRDHDLIALVRQAAEVARRFHRAGFNHRDFYCCHFFVAEETPSAFRVNLIDLQRMQRRRWRRTRWIVKDLAQLAYSAPRERISRATRLRFIKHYLGIQRLRSADKRLIRRVLAKQQSMQRRLGTHP